MITSPTLLLDKEQCLANISRMADKAAGHGLSLKPHFKTHQSAEIAEWFRGEGVNAATVSSVQMAGYFADNGWKNLTIAFPANIREMDRLNRLAESVDLSLLVIGMKTADYLDEYLREPVEVYIEIDTGSNRTGLTPDDTGRIGSLIERFNQSDKLRFAGFYSHPGHSYSARSYDRLESIHNKVLADMAALKNEFRDRGNAIRCCIGDTPCASVMDTFEGIDEISPGNFVFYDLMQQQIGSCEYTDIAVALACPVTAKHPSRNEIILHGGAVHLSKEILEQDGNNIYGIPVRLDDRDHRWSEPVPNSYLRTISQEHGILTCSSSFFNSIDVGELVGILPVHSCLTADLMRGYTLVGTGGGRAVSHLKSPVPNR